MGRAKDRVIFLDTRVSSRTWSIVSVATTKPGTGCMLGKKRDSDLPPLHITRTLHEIPQGLVAEVDCSHVCRGREEKSERHRI